MQHREPQAAPRSALEALLARQDDAALDYVTDELIGNGSFSEPPAQPEAERTRAGRSSGREPVDEPVEAG